MSKKSMVNLGVLCMVALIEGADIQLLPASFRALEADLGISPTRLALLTLLQGCAGAASGPLWASLADAGFSRRRLLFYGSLGWGLVTLALASVRSFACIATLRMLNGVTLGMMLPVLQSLVADISDQGDLGFMFGCLQFYTNFGQVFGAVAVTTSSNQLIWGIQGWRVAFTFVGLASVLISVILHVALKEDPRPFTPERVGLRQELRKLFGYLRIRTFVVLVLQGMFGMVPWAALSFATMYFQYLGLSDLAASMVYGMSIVGTALGGVLGGVIGDRWAAWSPRHGRIFTAQLTAFMGIPLVILIFLVPFNAPPVIYSLLCFALGLLSSWASSACNRPILTEIVPPHSRASAMAWEVTLESTCGFLVGPPAVGLLAEHFFGYKLSRLQASQMPEDARLANARALGRGMVLITVVPWIICLLAYSLLHLTLAADAQRAKDGGKGGHMLHNGDVSEATPFAGLAACGDEAAKAANDSTNAASAGQDGGVGGLPAEPSPAPV